MTVVTFLPSGCWTPRCELIRRAQPDESAPQSLATLQQSWAYTRALILRTLERFPDALEAVRIALNQALDAALAAPVPEPSP